MKKIIKLIMVALMMMLVLTPTAKVEAKKKYSTITIKADTDIKKAVPKIHNYLMKGKGFNLKVKGNKKQAIKKVAKIENQIQQYNKNGVMFVLEIDPDYVKTKKGYTTYNAYCLNTENYIFYNKVVDKMEEEVTTWVQSLTPEKQAQVASTPRYLVGSGQKTFGELTDYEKIKFISDHQVFSCEYAPKNHVGMYYNNAGCGGTHTVAPKSSNPSLLTGDACGVCAAYAGAEEELFKSLGIYTQVDYTYAHAYTSIYMKDNNGNYRWYLFDYKLFEDINAISRNSEDSASLDDYQKVGKKPDKHFKWSSWETDIFLYDIE